MTPQRETWRARRKEMERLTHAGGQRQSSLGEKSPLVPLWNMDWIALPLRLCRLWRRGLDNARRVGLVHLEVTPQDLPQALDGFRILHLSDLHVGNIAGQLAEMARALAGIRADLVVLTGDFQTRGLPGPGVVAAELSPLLAALDTPEAPLAILGNHDEADLVEALEGIGVRVLINQAHVIGKNGATMTLVGVDDVHAFHTPEAAAALAQPHQGFKVALVHSPDFASLAARHGYGLYLCGHTHGGQICLPGGRPVYTVQDTHRPLARAGLWRWQGMVGHTSPGLGSSRPPVRLNCPPAATLITLRSP